MKDKSWDDYYDGNCDDSLKYMPEDCRLHIDDVYNPDEDYEHFDSVRYYGPKTNATIQEIRCFLQVNQQSDKFLYNEDTVVILLDYSVEIVDKWKNGTVLYCYGEKKYRNPKDMENLSIIDKKLFGADSRGETRVFVFWKDMKPNYDFIYGFLVLNREAFQIEEQGGFRWVFPLSVISKKFVAMPEKYSFNVAVNSVEEGRLKNSYRKDVLDLVEFNNNDCIEEADENPTYKGIPQEKMKSYNKQESIGRRRKVCANVLRMANYECEINSGHETFIRKVQNVKYTEAHHLVPLSYSELFEYSLDIEENVVSLCSTCHNQIHYGKGAATMIKKLFSERKALLEKARIILSEQELLAMYGLNEQDD